MKSAIRLVALVLGASVTGTPACADIFDGMTGYATLGWNHTQSDGLVGDSATVRVGARFNTYVGIEAEGNIGLGPYRQINYNAGCPAGMACIAVVTTYKSKLGHSEALYGRGFLPIFPGADLTARIGYGIASYDSFSFLGVTTTGAYASLGNGGFSRNVIKVGVGFQYDVDGFNGFRVDYTRDFFTDNSPIGIAALGEGQNILSLSYVRSF